MSDKELDNYSEFFPDYVAECEEHLTSAAQILFGLEVDPSRIDRDQLDGLFRSFHTIKGLSGMVGVREAERLAHHLESYLGAVRKAQLTLTVDGVGLLIKGVSILGQVIIARRDGLRPLDIDSLVAQIGALVPGLSPQDSRGTLPESSPSAKVEPGLPAEKRTKIEQAERQGAQAWQVTFTPTTSLAQRGITVNTVRERLLAFGEIVHAEPMVLTGGGVRFSFVVTSNVADFVTGVQTDGLNVKKFALSHSVPEVHSSETGRMLDSRNSVNLVRVDLRRLDDLMRTIGELVITRARLDKGLERLASTLSSSSRRELQETSQVMERQLRDLREGVMRVRMVPVRDLFSRMRFVVRDLAQEAGKDVELHLTGEETEFDKFVVERLSDPLLHLVRNSVSHGIETAVDRASAGKPLRGRLDLRAAAVGGVIVIEVEDDGRGVDLEQVFARARVLGLVAPNAPIDPDAVLDLLCSSGFSTRQDVDRTSGRGVGMDVVRRAVEELGGTLTLFTRPGQGTRFTARLPLTLAIADALIVSVGSQSYAVPQATVREIVQVYPDSVTVLENNDLLRLHRGVLPLLHLSALFGSTRPKGTFPALVVGEGGNVVALAVDKVLGLREIVVRPLSDPLVQVPGVAAATELGDGCAVLILDVASLAIHARTRGRSIPRPIGVAQ